MKKRAVVEAPKNDPGLAKRRARFLVVKARREGFVLAPATLDDGRAVMRAAWKANGADVVVDSRAMTIAEFHSSWVAAVESVLDEAAKRMDAEDRGASR